MEADEVATTAAAAAEADRSLADRLDAIDAEPIERLDAGEAERVLHRALELEAEASEQPHFFTPAQLEKIAGEIGVDAAHVRTALGEVRLGAGTRTRFERLVIPEPLIELETIDDMSRDEVDQMVERWMKDNEGLIERKRLANGIDWDVDRRISARVRATLTSGGNRISRAAGGDISHRVQSVSTSEHVVALQSRGDGPIALAKASFALAAAVLVLGIVTSAATTAIAFVPAAAGAIIGAATIAAGGIATARSWARRVGRALRRSLTNMAPRGRATSRPSIKLPWRRS